MKIISLSLILLVSAINTSAQTDSIQKPPIYSFKNNFQTNTLGVFGYFALQYERGLNKDFSVSLISNFNNAFASNSNEAFFTHIEGRFYLDKNTVLNNGIYLACDIGFMYKRYYHESSSYYGYPTAYTVDYKYTWIGLGLGYQLLAKKRWVVDLNAIAFVAPRGKYNNSYDNSGWHNLNKWTHSGSSVMLNIGYAF
jgi:hypothetical protein